MVTDVTALRRLKISRVAEVAIVGQPSVYTPGMTVFAVDKSVRSRQAETCFIVEECTRQKSVLRMTLMAFRTKAAKVRVTMTIHAFRPTSSENFFPILTMTGFTGQKVVMSSQGKLTEIMVL